VRSGRNEESLPVATGETKNKEIQTEETQMANRNIAKEARMPGALTPRMVAEAWFSNLEQGDMQGAQALLDENIVWENTPTTPGVSDLAPWLGTYQGIPAVMKSIEVWAQHARLLSFKLLRLIVDGPEAVGIVHEHGRALANNNEYDVYVAENIRIEGGRITHYRVYWDVSPIIKALRSI
jgi:ketosteroid isomerase-like protein